MHFSIVLIMRRREEEVSLLCAGRSSDPKRAIESAILDRFAHMLG
jgi:hypothetical protein